MSAEQIPFDIPLREAFEAEDYLVTATNAAAVGWIDRWPDWGDSHCVILYGTAGCGKTHLSHVWQHKSGAVRARLDQISFSESHDNLIVEDIDKDIQSPPFQEKLFHLYNWQKEKGGMLMLTARSHPNDWPLSLPDLSSRMLASMILEIGPPDDELLTAVIVKQFMDRQINVPIEVVQYLIPRIERSFEAARDIVSKIDILALVRKRKITVPLIRELLE
ncbi:MAG: DNA replication protein [Alphaproteobacteria bacterium]|nr:DNA replication protein [Alphaproteobacteria bacterium]